MACWPPSYRTARTLTFSRVVVSNRVEAGIPNIIGLVRGEEEGGKEEDAIFDARTGRDVTLALSDEDDRAAVTERAVAVAVEENALVVDGLVR